MFSLFNSVLYALVVILSSFMILLVLIQRGKGGGLAGAFGGVGGSSAFGTKAGDVFTRVTIYTALAWFLVCMLLVYRMNQGRTSAFGVESRIKTESKSTTKGEPGSKSDSPITLPGTSDLPAPRPEVRVTPPPSGIAIPPAPNPATTPAPSAIPSTTPTPAPSTTSAPNPATAPVIDAAPTPAPPAGELPDPLSDPVTTPKAP